jgi:hypothetical protein
MTLWYNIPHRKVLEGIVPRATAADGNAPALDLFDLQSRGWTRTLVDRYLGHEDRSEAVGNGHYYSPKKLFLLERVESAEIMPEFVADMERSVRRRRLTAQEAADYASRRAGGQKMTADVLP